MKRYSHLLQRWMILTLFTSMILCSTPDYTMTTLLLTQIITIMVMLMWIEVLKRVV